MAYGGKIVRDNTHLPGVDVGTSSGLVLAASAGTRNRAFIQNVSNVDVWIAFGVAAVINECILLPANGGAYEMSEALGNLSHQVVNGIAASGASNRVTVMVA